MSHDPYGSGTISERERAERIVREAVRRVKLEAKNDPNFVPTADDASAILAGRHYVLQPTMPTAGPDDAQAVLAQRVFGKGRGGDGVSATPLDIPWTLVERDGLGSFAATQITVQTIRGTTGVTYDLILYKPDGTTQILRVPTGTVDLEARGKLTVLGAFGCNGKGAQTAVAAGAAAGGGTGGAGGVSGSAANPYDGPTQTLINDLAGAVNALASIVNAQASQITANATLSNTMRSALIANGILV